jgi:hypothetical protein
MKDWSMSFLGGEEESVVTRRWSMSLLIWLDGKEGWLVVLAGCRGWSCSRYHGTEPALTPVAGQKIIEWPFAQGPP